MPTLQNQKGLTPIAILFLIAIVSVTGVFIYKIKNNQRPITQNSQNSISTPTPTSSPNKSITPSPKAKTTQTPIPTITIKPTNTPGPTATNTPTSTPKSTCAINALATPEDTSANFDNPKTIQLIYSASTTDNKYMTGAQWDFDGNGSWDTDMSQSNGSVAHTFPNDGSYTVKLQLKMSDGEITPTCSKTITVPMGLTVNLTGQVYSDKNCNGVQEPDESGIPGVTVNIFKMPGTYLYTTLTTDNDGRYSLTRVIDPQSSLNVEPSSVAAYAYKINADLHTISLGGSQTSMNIDLPQVPAENIGSCNR